MEFDGELIIQKGKMKITISSYDNIIYQEWTLRTCLEDLEQKKRCGIWNTLFQSNEEMFSSVMHMFKSFNSKDKLFKCSMTDEGDLRVDFLTKHVLKKNLNIRFFLKKVDTNKHTDLINICVKILQTR